jgi:hypothetical protein
MQTQKLDRYFGGFWDVFLTISLVSLASLISESQPTIAQSAHLGIPPCTARNGCRQLPTDNRFRNSLISQSLVNQLPRWSNICKRLTGKTLPCYVSKTYRFKDGTVAVQVSGTESFLTDIKFTSSINQARAVNMVRQLFNDGNVFTKTENLSNKIVFYANPFDNGNETIYLNEINLILDSRNQVNRILAISTSP